MTNKYTRKEFKILLNEYTEEIAHRYFKGEKLIDILKDLDVHKKDLIFIQK